MKSILIFALFFQVIIALASAEGMAVVISEDAGPIGAESMGLGILRDPDGSLSLEDVRRAFAEGSFQPLPGNLGGGYTKDVVWIGFSMSRGPDVPGDWILEVQMPYLDDVRLYAVAADGAVSMSVGGDLVPLSKKTIAYRTGAFPLSLSQSETKYYLRVQSTSTLAVIPKLWQAQSFALAVQREHALLGVYFGLFTAIILFNLVSFHSSRNFLHLLFSAHVLGLTLQWFGVNGLFGLFLFHDNPMAANASVPITYGVGISFTIAFYILILRVDRLRHPWTYRYLVATSLIGMATAASFFLGAYWLMAPILSFAILSASLVILRPGFELWRTKATGDRLILLSFLLYMSFVWISLLTALGVVKANLFSAHAAQIGNLAHVLMMDFGIFLQARNAAKAREEALRQAKQARMEADLERHAKEERDHMLNMITHEVRTPISIIDAATQSLRSLDPDPDHDRAKRYRRIHNAIERINALLELSLSRDHESVVDWAQAWEPIDMKAMTADILSLLGGDDAERAELFMEQSLPLITGDARLIRFCLLNILDNAFKYSPPGSPVGIEVAAGREEGRDGVAVTVINGGEGIPRGMEEAIFEKYRRGGERSGQPGLGLGLYLARHIAQKHGGWLKLDCPGGQEGDVRFVCWFPADVEEEEDGC